MFLLGCASKTLYAQTGTSIPTAQTDQQSEQARKIQLVQALERAQTEVKSSRKYIGALEEQVKSKESIIEAQAARQTLADEAIRLLETEVQQLRRIIKNNEDGLKIQEAEILYLKKELDQTNKKLKRSRAVNRYLIIIAAAAVALKALF